MRFLYLQRTAFGGKVTGQNYGVQVAYAGRFDVSKLGPMLADLNERLSGVIIENLNYSDFIARYDGPGGLFYLDPPYFGSENDYGKGMVERADFERLATQLAGIQGMFILSINATPEIRSIFSAFNLDEVDLTYTIGNGEPKPVTEFIITPKNLPLRPVAAPGLFDD